MRWENISWKDKGNFGGSGQEIRIWTRVTPQRSPSQEAPGRKVRDPTAQTVGTTPRFPATAETRACCRWLGPSSSSTRGTGAAPPIGGEDAHVTGRHLRAVPCGPGQQALCDGACCRDRMRGDAHIRAVAPGRAQPLSSGLDGKPSRLASPRRRGGLRAERVVRAHARRQ